jgi:hypothetical protein
MQLSSKVTEHPEQVLGKAMKAAPSDRIPANKVDVRAFQKKAARP